MNKMVRNSIIILALAISCKAVFGSDETIEYNRQLVEMAISGNDSEFLNTVDYNKLVNVADSSGQTPLFAALFGSPELVKNMLKRGSNVQHQDNNGMTPLISASMLGYYDAVKLLLENGADIKHTMKDGNHALKVAIVSASANALPTDNKYHHQFSSTVQELVDRGADVHTIDYYGAPLLLYPIFNKNYLICETLLKAKANPNATYKNSTLLKIAKQYSSPDIIKLLIQYGAQ